MGKPLGNFSLGSCEDNIKVDLRKEKDLRKLPSSGWSPVSDFDINGVRPSNSITT